MSRASSDERTVPKTSAAMPNRTLASGSHCFVVQKLLLSAWNAGSAFTTRKTAIAARMTNTRRPAARVMPRKIVSPRRVDPAARSPAASEPVATMLIVPPCSCDGAERGRGRRVPGPATRCVVASADARERGLVLRHQRLRQRGEAELVGDLLPRGDVVVQERLQQLGLVGIAVLLAQDHVGHRGDRVAGH